MPRKAAVEDNIYQDEAEGFILKHSLMGLPRTWPPVAPEPGPSAQSVRLEAASKKMDWNDTATSEDDVDMTEYLRTKEEDADKERCVICLMALRDRTVVGICGHEFCFTCIGVWANQSRRCPLCSADMAPFLLHDLDAKSPTKFYLPPLPQPKQLPSASIPSASRQSELEERWKERGTLDEIDNQVVRRREIYRHELYAKHVASNPTTGFRPSPTPRQFSEDQSLINRTATFLRRELRVWSLVDVEFLTTYILSLLKAIDIRSEPAIRLIAEFLDTPDGPQYPHGAEHFAHELYTFLRSPFKDLRLYDELLLYDPLPSGRKRANSRLSSSGSSSSSRSPPPIRSPPRRRRDSYRPSRSPTAKRWDESDTWVDPDYEAWLREERRREKERLNRRYSRKIDRDYPGAVQMKPSRPKQVELLPEHEPSPPLRMLKSGAEAVEVKVEKSEPTNIISIKGAAKDPSKKLSLVERLARAKQEAAIFPKSDVKQEPSSPSAISNTIDSNLPAIPVGARTIVQARLKLRLKLQAEKEKALSFQSARTAYATVLRPRTRSVDNENRQAELKRRLLIAKVLSAETEQERKERELREKLYKRKLENGAKRLSVGAATDRNGGLMGDGLGMLGDVEVDVDAAKVGYVVHEDRPREMELKAKLAARKRNGVLKKEGAGQEGLSGTVTSIKSDAIKKEDPGQVDSKLQMDLEIDGEGEGVGEGEGAELYDM